MRKLVNFVSILLMAASFLLPFLTFMAPYVYNVTLHVILSESMSPNINIGDVVVIEGDFQPKDINVGDVIAFQQPDIRIPITHRVADIIQADTTIIGYRTKGDAIEHEDHWIVTPVQVIGKVIFRIPKLGYITKLVKRRSGYNLLVVLPGVLLIILETKDLLNPERTTIRRSEWFRGPDRTTAYLFLIACIMVMGMLQGLISQNMTRTPLTEFEAFSDGEHGKVEFAHTVDNETPFPLIMCLGSESAPVTFSQEQLRLSPGAQQRITMWSQDPEEAMIVKVGFLPILPAKILKRIFAWNTKWAPLLAIGLPGIPLTIVGFAVLGGFSPRPDRRTRSRELRRRLGY